jgi:transcriptional regulator with XRE-family HTH domain
VMAAGSPTVRRRRLAAELRRLRGGQTGTAVARALGWSPAKISRYELGQGGFPPDEVEKLLDFYGVTEPRRGQLLSLAMDANRRGWWEEYADAISPDYSEFIGLEAEAPSVEQWQIETIPGLFQTRDYAWHIHNAIQEVMPTAPIIIERRVDVRMTRQHVLLRRDPPLRLSVVLDESALLREIGGPGVMRDQLMRLAEMAEMPNVDLRVLPLRDRTGLMATSFVLFKFFSPAEGVRPLSDVVSTENPTAGEGFKVETESDTYIYQLLFDAFSKASLTPEESLRLVRECVRSYQ